MNKTTHHSSFSDFFYFDFLLQQPKYSHFDLLFVDG